MRFVVQCLGLLVPVEHSLDIAVLENMNIVSLKVKYR